MASEGGRGAPVTELRGTLLPPPLLPSQPGAEVEEDEEEEPEEESPFADMALLAASDGEAELAAALPPRRAVIIQDEETKEEYDVVGRFPIVAPWWTVHVKVKKTGSKCFVQGFPSYFLRTNIEENNQHVFSLFLKECGVPDGFKQEFFTWLPGQPLLSFAKLEEKLKQFQASYSTKKQGNSKNFDIFQYVLKSFAGKAVLVAMHFPKIMEYLPVLLPHHFCCLLEKVCWRKEPESDDDDARVEEEHCQDDVLRKLDEILNNEPWKLGFSKITYRELNLSYCEATWAAFRQCNHLLPRIPELQRNALILYDRLKKQCTEMGHTYEDQDELTHFVSRDMSIENAWQSLEFLKDQHIVIRKRKMVFLPHLYNSEKNIATCIGGLLSNHSWQLDVDVRQILNVSEISREIVDMKMNATQEMECVKENDPESHDCENSFLKKEVESTFGSQSKGEVDLDQVTAMEKICTNPVTIISGKGGCGKSTIVSYLFRHLKQMEKEMEEVEAASKDFERDLDASEEWNTFNHHWESENTCTKNLFNVLFTAPTGRAASLLSEKTRFPAYTLHQIIYSFKSWKSSQSQQELPWKFSTVTILVVDEGSLVSVQILSLVLKLLCEHAQLAKLIILGDTRQLPSIDPGNVLADIFEGLKSKGLSVELRTNHRAESQLIVDNATRISHRKLPEFDEVLKVSDWNGEQPMPSPEKKFIFIALPSGGSCDNLQNAIKTLLAKGPGLQDARQSQFIAFRRQDCDLINELCCQHYSNHLTRDHKRRLLFRTDDKICCMRNTYLKDLLPGQAFSKDPERQKCENGKSSLAEEGKRLCNGDIFFITDDVEVNKQRLLTISSTYGSTYTVVYKALKKLCHIKHAWARTIHTFQGSEVKTVVYVVGNPGRQHWQHVYTAVTRGRCRVYVIAEEMHLKKAVTNKSRPRKTQLQKFLRETIAEINYPVKQTSLLLKESGQVETQSVTQSAPDLSEPVADSLKQEGSGVPNEEMSNALQLSPYKRQRSPVANSGDAAKTSLTNQQDTPLGSWRLRNLSLEHVTPKKLFKN